jgi:hypothetical protein
MIRMLGIPNTKQNVTRSTVTFDPSTLIENPPFISSIHSCTYLCTFPSAHQSTHRVMRPSINPTFCTPTGPPIAQLHFAAVSGNVRWIGPLSASDHFPESASLYALHVAFRVAQRRYSNCSSCKQALFFLSVNTVKQPLCSARHGRESSVGLHKLN